MLQHLLCSNALFPSDFFLSRYHRQLRCMADGNDLKDQSIFSICYVTPTAGKGLKMHYQLLFFGALLQPGLCKCPSGTVQGIGSTDCYIYRSQPTFWFDAEEYCIGRGGHLSSISNIFLNEFVRDVANSACGAEYWLGGGWNSQTPNKWVWTDGMRFSYTHWASGIKKSSLSLQFNFTR